MSYGICHFLFGCLFFPGFSGLRVPSWLPCLIRRVAPNPRIQRSEFVNSYQFSILSSSQDSMHCTLSITVCLCTPCQKSKLHQHNRFFLRGHDPYTLACKARPSFDGCRTSLSVSLSLSLSYF